MEDNNDCGGGTIDNFYEERDDDLGQMNNR
jgi:hypothetical protein